MSFIIPVHCCLYVVNVYNICFLYLCNTPYGVLLFENKLLSLSVTQHTSQTDQLTEQHRKYKDITLPSPQLKSNKLKMTNHRVLTN